MERWQYQTMIVEAEKNQYFQVYEDDLNQLGDDGWELVSVVPISFSSQEVNFFTHGGEIATERCQLIFKRQKHL